MGAIGRDAELAALTATLEAAVAGEPAVVLLSGERRALIGAAIAIGDPRLARTYSGSVAAALVLAACIGAGQFVTEVVSARAGQRRRRSRAAAWTLTYASGGMFWLSRNTLSGS
jgi:hypothetical protein